MMKYVFLWSAFLAFFLTGWSFHNIFLIRKTEPCIHDSRLEKGTFECRMMSEGGQMTHAMQVQVFGNTYDDLQEAFKRAAWQLRSFGHEEAFNIIAADQNKYGYKIEAGVITKPVEQSPQPAQLKPVAPPVTKRRK